MQSAIQGRLNVTVAPRTPQKVMPPAPKTSTPQVAAAHLTKASFTKATQNLAPPKTVHKPRPKQLPEEETQHIASSQPQAKKIIPQVTEAPPYTEPVPTHASPPLQQLASFKLTPESAATELINTTDKPQHAVNKSAATIPAILAIESNYTAALLKAIEHHRHYPLRARRRGDEGEVLIDFTILKNGKITGIQIASTSHSTSLDHAASKALEQLGQFKPIPRQLQRNSWDFRIPVRFALN